MILYIDTKDQKQIKVALKENNKVVAEMAEENEFGSQVLLPLIKKILDIKRLRYKDIKAIGVETGPGSFTGLKVGAAVANALGFALGIPVNGKRQETELQY